MTRRNNAHPFIKIITACFIASIHLDAAGQDSPIPPISDTEVPELLVRPVSNHARISIGFNYYRGSFITTVPKAEYVRDSYASFAEADLRFQTLGPKADRLRHRFPSWGFALLYGNTGSKKYVGNLFAVYPYLDLPLLRAGKYTLSLKAGAGAGFVNKPYDVVSNPKNTMIGTSLNAFINAVVKNEFQIGHRLSVNAGIGFMHLSNGGTTLPNLGLNTPGLSLGLRYSLLPEYDYEKLARDYPPGSRPGYDAFHRQVLYRVQTSAGLRQASWVGGNHYLINLVQGEAGIRTAPNHYFGAGIQLVYNRSLDYRPSDTPADPVHAEKFQAGIYAAYEHHFGKLSFPFQVGLYLYNRNLYPVIFQQYGARLAFNKNWNGFVMLKSHLGKADFIHTGVGYKF
ncbi:MAG: hypothetical protein EOO05_08860 [Chitinophagaceae bacterium]|nr:MAG: hypothetical protein EOO05_08860 [Chitinophagaceae bacterium]